MTALLDRLAQREGSCMAVHGPTGSRCTRPDPHTAGDIHQRGALTWGARDPQRPAWLDHLSPREMTGTPL